MDHKFLKWMIDRVIVRLDRQNALLERIATALERQAPAAATDFIRVKMAPDGGGGS